MAGWFILTAAHKPKTTARRKYRNKTQILISIVSVLIINTFLVNEISHGLIISGRYLRNKIIFPYVKFS
jgi:hypothetical protein